MSIHRFPGGNVLRNRPTHYSEKTGNGYYCGTWPLTANSSRPADGVSVTYLLFDADSELIYVGSTKHFYQRMKQHRDKNFYHWAAFPCFTRDIAYNVEARFLQLHMPPLNRRREALR